VIDLDVSTLQEIKLKRSKFHLSPRSDQKWIWVEKESSSLDYEAVESFARNLSHIKAITLEGSSVLKEAGLETPEATVSLKFSGSPVELQLKLGKLKGADTYFAALSGSKAWEGEVFTFPKSGGKIKAPSNNFSSFGTQTQWLENKKPHQNPGWSPTTGREGRDGGLVKDNLRLIENSTRRHRNHGKIRRRSRIEGPQDAKAALGVAMPDRRQDRKPRDRRHIFCATREFTPTNRIFSCSCALPTSTTFPSPPTLPPPRS
jgi:hypothetical protein